LDGSILVRNTLGQIITRGNVDRKINTVTSIQCTSDDLCNLNRSLESVNLTGQGRMMTPPSLLSNNKCILALGGPKRQGFNGNGDIELLQCPIFN